MFNKFEINKNKIISFLLIFLLIVGWMSGDIVKADDTVNEVEEHQHINEDNHDEELELYASETIKPQIDINYLGTTPSNPMEGQDFKVRYQIVPHPFQHNLSKPKEIVMVLDVSGSMAGTKISNLKIAAKNFINTMSDTLDDKITPKISNLKIGIITYSKNGKKEYDLVEVTNESSVNSKNVENLIKEIEGLKADGGTNTGDGLRKGANMLYESKSDANKAIIFMGDGEPTYYTYEGTTNQSYWKCNCTGIENNGCGRIQCTSSNPCKYSHGWNKNCKEVTETVNKYYTTLNYDNKSVGGKGSSDNDGMSLGYATTIGNIIKDKKYNVFTIGYGLGDEDSDANIKMKTIHESMGGITLGEKSTFFATDTGAIDSVFSKIADTLEKSYSFSDAQLNLNLSDSIQAVDGFSVDDGNGNIIKVDPINYVLGKGNWYTADTQIIEFTIRANKVGDYNLFKGNDKLTYTDIYGNKKEIPVENTTISIKPFEASEAQKLGVDFHKDSNGYLIGDTLRASVTLTHPGMDGIIYNNAKFNAIKIPNNFNLTGENGVELYFGTVDKTISKEYEFEIGDDEEVTTDNEKVYILSGNYSYILNQNGANTSINGDNSLAINVKRGQINVKVIDEEGNDITNLSNIVIKDKLSNEINGELNEGSIVFNNISSGNHELVIKSLPDGCTPLESGNNAKVGVNYTNNVVNYIFKVTGTVASSELDIQANLIGNTPSYPYVGDEITITYEIDPKEFVKSQSGNINFNNAKLLFNLGDKFTAVEDGGLVKDSDGKYSLDFRDKIKYTYDSVNDKYIADKFTVSFKVIANTHGNDLTFRSANIEFENILSSNNESIINDISMPTITVIKNEVIPEYNGPDIRILEIEPADSFKLTRKSGAVGTGTEEVLINQFDNEYKVEITHMTMAEFIGKVDDLNGKYDVIVVGRYVDNSFSVSNYGENILWFKDYVALENDITDKKASEIEEFINSGQLVYIDEAINDLTNSEGFKIYNYTVNEDGKWNQQKVNLVKDMRVSTNDNSKRITIDNIVEKYVNYINSNISVKRPITISSSPVGDTHEDILGAVYKRNMRFDIKSSVMDEDVKINLYLDINGDGLFKEEEIVKQVNNVRIPEEGYRLEYNFYNDYPQFIGYVDWRIEVVKEISENYYEPIKSYFDGNILFRRLTEEKQVINVLQISPFGRGNLNSGANSSASSRGGNLNLATNAAFQALLKQKEVQDYEIIVEVISYEDFYQGNYAGPGKDSLNGSKYDMVIMGFADAFIENISMKGIEEIKEFISTGQGLMLTHDTIWYKTWQYGANIRKANKLVKTFRDYIGQSRYIDPLNPEEKDLDGTKIEHDSYVPATNNTTESYANEAGATLAEMTNLTGGINGSQGVNLTNSIEVYKTNETLLTNYPFSLGETIRVRRTHGQYLQLNFEDDDVVPVFNLTNNNGDISSLSNAYKNSIVNKYDSRNYYYTYSRGNITFSGTGENQREAIEYPDSELRLFVNTIVKAERGANHKPSITALENITEISPNVDLNFNIVVKDIDGDLVKVTNVKLNGESINSGNNIPSEFKTQGSSFPITISKNKFGSIDEEMIITIEAEDKRGAKTTKDYVVIPTLDPLLVASEQNIETLVGESVQVKIELDKQNEDGNSYISNINAEESYNSDYISINNINIINEDNKTYLVGDLVAKNVLAGHEINIAISYTSKANTKTTTAKIIVNSKQGEVTVIVTGVNGENLAINTEVILENTNGEQIKGRVSESDGQVRFNSVKSGSYSVSIGESEGYTISEVLPTNKFTLNYEKNSQSVYAKLVPKIADMTHGLYEGVSGNSILINENINGFEMAAEANINFGSTFKLRGNGVEIRLKVANELLDTDSKNNIKVYKVVEGSGEAKLQEIDKNKISVMYEAVGYKIRINENIQSDTQILIRYTGKIPKESSIFERQYTNNITINGESKDVKVYTTKKSITLPDLF